MQRRPQQRITKKFKNQFRNKEAEAELIGTDPSLEGENWKHSNAAYVHAMSYFRYYHTPGKSRAYVEEYVKNLPRRYKPHQYQDLRRVRDCWFTSTMCGIAKMLNAGCELGEEPRKHLAILIKDLLDNRVPEIDTTEKVVQRKDNPVIMKLEESLDDFFRSDYKTASDSYKILQQMAPKAFEVSAAIKYYEPLADELNSKDPGYKEAYSRLRKKELTAYRAFVDDILTQCRLFMKNTKQEKVLGRAKRAPKAKPAAKLVSRLQFRESDPSLKIVSIKPEDIVGAHTLWFFNTKYRVLGLVKSKAGGLSVKGTTVINIDEGSSSRKKLRKPEQQLAELLNCGYKTMEAMYAKFKTVAIPVNGRINKETVLLKALR